MSEITTTRPTRQLKPVSVTAERERFRKVVGKFVPVATLTGRAEIRPVLFPQAKESLRVIPRRNGTFADPAWG